MIKLRPLFNQLEQICLVYEIVHTNKFFLYSFNEDKEKDKSGDRWTQLNSMVEARYTDR